MKSFLSILALLLIVSTATAQEDNKSAPLRQTAEVYFLKVDGIISSGTHKYIKKAIDNAVKSDAAALVIKLNTPGGLLEATRNIVQEILASPIPIVVYVAPSASRAGSAGAFITLAANYAIMADGTSIGAAHPVSLSGSDIEGDMREKALNDTTSFMRSIAESRGRNMDEAILMVTQSKSFTASEALRAGIIDGVIHSDDALLMMLEQELSIGACVKTEIAPNIRERLGFALASPDLLVILFLLGALMFFLEFKMPGTFVFAGIGFICLILFLVGINIIPVNGIGLLLIVLGIGLLIGELFVTSFGLMALAGVASLVGGLWLLFDTDKTQGVTVSLSLLIAVVLTTVAVILLLGRLILKDHFKKPMLGMASVIGKKAEVLAWNGSMGQVRVHGEIWKAVSEENFSVGDEAEVVEADDFSLKIKR
ncbi:MAG: nodulation protein NfeD [Deferribacteraceae bacterium]|jgi:membrane-bound serine protease (ClpP class)|nr:nodulation protein NfeD [Deferribacteraceae bacterium]